MTATVYGFQDATGAVLYVGCTERPAERVATGHRRKPWWPDVDQAVIFLSGIPLNTALQLERALIEALEPVGNTVFTRAWRNAMGVEARSVVPAPCPRAAVAVVVAGFKKPAATSPLFTARIGVEGATA